MRRGINAAGTVLDRDAVIGVGPALPALPAMDGLWDSDSIDPMAHLAPGIKVFTTSGPIVINTETLADAIALREWLIEHLFGSLVVTYDGNKKVSTKAPDSTLKQQAITALHRELNWDGPNKVMILKALNMLPDS